MGVTKVVKKPGDGTTFPKKGDKVEVHYVGTLHDGSQFDSSRERGFPFTFNIGFQQVIKGWDVGVAQMSVGERAVLTISPDFAYGERAIGPIPPNSTLTFDVELLSIGGPGSGMKSTMWNTLVGLLLVLFATALVGWAVHDLYTKEVWGKFRVA